MTDESARENFAKYGNPDGPGNFQVGIALPATLQDKESQILILVSFFMIICVVIPWFFYTNIFREEKDIGNVNTNNRKIFNDMIDSDMVGKKIPGIVG